MSPLARGREIIELISSKFSPIIKTFCREFAVLALLEVKNLSLQYDGRGAQAVNNISFDLQGGDILALLGPSGCGKTSLLRLIAGFERPQRGTIGVDGRIISSPDRVLPPEQRQIAIVFQDYALFPHLTVYQNVAFGLKSGNSAKIVPETLDKVGLASLGHQYPHQLSGGQQQRVALARALITNPILVLLDEPLSNIDVQLRTSLRQELRDILKQSGTAGIWVTHDQEEAMAVSDWIGVMQEGRLEQWGTPQAIYFHPQTPFVAQFVPQANLLPITIKADKIVTDLGEFPLSLTEPKQLMIRQEDIELTIDPTSKVLITDRVFLGRDWVYRIKFPSGREILARQPTKEAPLAIDTKVAIGGKWELL